MKKLLFLLLFPILVFGQTNPPPPPPTPASPSPQEDFGTTQNGIMGAQSRSFGGGSIIKPNQILNSADFALIGSPTYETFTFRPGTSLGWGKITNSKGFGVNAVLTFDLSQQAYSFYRRNKNWYYHINFGKLEMALNTGGSITRIFESKKIKNFNGGIQIGTSIVANGKSTDKDAYFVAVPYLVLLAQKEFKFPNKINYKPEAYVTICSPYYDIGMNYVSTSSTFNAVVSNCFGFQLTKHFKVSLTHRANINTTPKFGLMHNILFGTTLNL